ncbi:hypothetical protein VC212_05815 [Xanthomonas sp. WHRI 8932A]|nr:hypothetical protein [Xanthomonas sp. WHRI 8932A]
MSGGSASLSLVEGGSSVDGRPDLGLQGLVLLAQFHGIAADAAQLAHGFGRAMGDHQYILRNPENNVGRNIVIENIFAGHG